MDTKAISGAIERSHRPPPPPPAAAEFNTLESVVLHYTPSAAPAPSAPLTGAGLRSKPAAKPTRADALKALRNTLAGRLNQVEDMFGRWDKDKSGTIDRQEFRDAATSFGLPGHDDVLFYNDVCDTLFNEYDADESQQVTYAEYVHYTLRDALRRSSGRIIHLFKLWDIDGNGVVDKDEWWRVVGHMGFTAPREVSDAVFDEIDEDESGTLDYKELHKALRQGHAVNLAEEKKKLEAAEQARKARGPKALKKGKPKSGTPPPPWKEMFPEPVIPSWRPNLSSPRPILRSSSHPPSQQETPREGGPAATYPFSSEATPQQPQSHVRQPPPLPASAVAMPEAPAHRPPPRPPLQRPSSAPKPSSPAPSSANSVMEVTLEKTPAMQRPSTAPSNKARRRVELVEVNSENGEVNTLELRVSPPASAIPVPTVTATPASPTSPPGGSKLERTKSGVLKDAALNQIDAVANVEALASQLAKLLVTKTQLTRVIDLFREFDKDESGYIDTAEFHRGLGLLGLKCTRKASDELFAKWDKDQSGQVDYREMNKLLRAGSTLSPSGSPRKAGVKHLSVSASAPVLGLKSSASTQAVGGVGKSASVAGLHNSASQRSLASRGGWPIPPTPENAFRHTAPKPSASLLVTLRAMDAFVQVSGARHDCVQQLQTMYSVASTVHEKQGLELHRRWTASAPLSNVPPPDPRKPPHTPARRTAPSLLRRSNSINELGHLWLGPQTGVGIKNRRLQADFTRVESERSLKAGGMLYGKVPPRRNR